ncbi:MAG: AAA family ATPase [Phyllobacterium sp.]|uniref:AAA family ATPase n=1 Tax=Phyllobacterium sp. TaxID=1871046 RepID=UPI0030F35144
MGQTIARSLVIAPRRLIDNKREWRQFVAIAGQPFMTALAPAFQLNPTLLRFLNVTAQRAEDNRQLMTHCGIAAIVKREPSMPQLIQNNFIIVTGGPGAGKTSLITALEQDGYAASPEAGRAIIQHQQAIDGPALPWEDPALFAESMLSWELRSFDMATANPNITFFDRGVPDIIGYLELSGMAVPPHMLKAAERYRYNRSVLILPPWPEIFAQDAQRKQTLEEAEQTFHSMISAYGRFGYALIEVPRLPVSERVGFVRKHVAAVI